MELKINDRIKIRTIELFNNFELTLRHDSVASTFSFSFYFDPKNVDHAELACVSHWHEAIVYHNGEKLVTGYIVSNTFRDSSVKETAQIAGYSKPGILEDCDIPVELYPLETNGLSLKQITERIIKKFGLKLIIDADAKSESTKAFITDSAPNIDENGRIVESSNAVNSVTQNYSMPDRVNREITKATAPESKNIKSYLTELATQRNVIISHDSDGNLLFTEPKTTAAPLAHFEGGVIGTSVSLSYSGQGLHSHITVIRQADEDGGSPAEFTIRNPYVPILYRPKVVIQTSGDDITIQEFAQKELAKELKNVKLIITTDRWEISGKMIKPNNFITAKSPDLYLYKTATFFIESVNLKGNAKETTAVLTCTLPEVYNGAAPKNIFVDAHKNSGFIK